MIHPTITSSEVIEEALKHLPDYMPIPCPSRHDVMVFWPKSNTALDIYEIKVSLGIETLRDKPDMFGKALRRAAKLNVQKPLHIAFKDYRMVDASHVNKLHSLLTETYVQHEVNDVFKDGAPIIHGTLTLPGNFVLAHDFNKTVQAGTFNPEMGQKYLKDKMEIQADTKLWELEGYRLYRSLMTIDGFHDTYGSMMINPTTAAIDPATLIANCATVWEGPCSNFVYLEVEQERHRDLIATSEGKLNKCLVGIPKEYYERLLTIINTYIEF